MCITNFLYRCLTCRALKTHVIDLYVIATGKSEFPDEGILFNQVQHHLRRNCYKYNKNYTNANNKLTLTF